MTRIIAWLIRIFGVDIVDLLPVKRPNDWGFESEADAFLVEAADQHGFQFIGDDANVYVVNQDDLIAFIRMVEKVAIERGKGYAEK